MRAATAETARIGELVETVESDVGLAIAVLRFANRSVSAGGIASVPAAIEVLKANGVEVVFGLNGDHVLRLYDGLADSKYRPCPLLVKYVEAGWLGRKTQRGFYDYRTDPPTPTR